MVATVAQEHNIASAAFAATGKSKLNKVEKLNLDEYQNSIAAERRIIAELFKKMNDLTQRIKDCRGGQTDYVKKRDDLRRSLDTITAQIEALETERNKLFNQIEETQKTGRDMKSKVQTLKRDLGFQSEHEIDAKIREIERHMISKRLSVQDENRMIAQIKQLKSNKPLVGQYADLEANANSHAQVSVLPLKIRFDEVRDQLKTCQIKKRETTDKVRTLIEENQKSLSPINDLMDEKDRLKKEIALHRQEEHRLVEEMETKSREYRTQTAQLQRATQERRREEQIRRDAKHERENLQKQLDNMDEESWSPDYQLMQQTVLYVRKLVERMHSLSAVDKSQEEATAMDTPTNAEMIDSEGRVLMKPKSQREETYYFAPTKKKADKKQKKQQVSLRQPLVHAISTLGDFERLNVDPPLTLEDCPHCLSVLEAKLETLKAEQSRLNESVLKRKQKLLAKLDGLKAVSPGTPTGTARNAGSGTQSDDSANRTGGSS